MILGFWQTLPRPILAMAPLANVTDCAFRNIIAKTGKPHVLFTEFVSADGLQSEVAREKLLIDFKYSEIERPIVAQIFGAKPENCYKTALLIKDLGFDGIDINMGCPDKAVLKQGAGIALCKTPKLAQEIVLATKEGAGLLPVSVKTRTGFNRESVDEWIPVLLETGPAAITVHGRTCKELSQVAADWNAIAKAKKLAVGTGTLVLGNGDVSSREDALLKCAQYGTDGAMIGRAIFGNPWLFNPSLKKEDLSLPEQLAVLLEHISLFETWLLPHKNFDTMKKHFKAYVHGFVGAKELRMALMETHSSSEVKAVLEEFISPHTCPV
jgi:nifR3 family TIM-barrel protein